MTAGFHATDRAVLRLTGADTREFLQNLVTNDVGGLDRGVVYAALLSAQGKYLFDFFLVPDGEAVLIDVKADRAAALPRPPCRRRRSPSVSVADSGRCCPRG
jgi:folate-binding Fe-S cluster repair protein YgfZ